MKGWWILPLPTKLYKCFKKDNLWEELWEEPTSQKIFYNILSWDNENLTQPDQNEHSESTKKEWINIISDRLQYTS